MCIRDRDNIFGEYISNLGLTQLRIAETEKYAHVTFFFNGGVEQTFPGEDRCLIPSPKVATYDLQPEMSAYEVTEEAVSRILSGAYDVIILNLSLIHILILHMLGLNAAGTVRLPHPQGAGSHIFIHSPAHRHAQGGIRDQLAIGRHGLAVLFMDLAGRHNTLQQPHSFGSLVGGIHLPQ